jgi:hypothetical protein
MLLEIKVICSRSYVACVERLARVDDLSDRCRDASGL